MSKLGLALGGGGARGLAHIGVLKILDEEKIKISAITGCSMGAIIGGLYAYFGNAKEVEKFIFDTIKDPKFKRLDIDALSMNAVQPAKNYFERFIEYFDEKYQAVKALGRLSYFDEEVIEDIYSMIPDVPIESLKIKFSSIATDLFSGEEINFTNGSLRQTVKASSAIPGVFPPVEINGKLLVDGSASESIPAGKVKDIGADRVIAVDVTRNIKIVDPAKNIIDILYRTEDITSYHLSQIRLKEANLIIRPKIKNLSWADFSKINEIILAGEISVRENIKKIKKMTKRNKYLLEMDQYFKSFKSENK